MARDLSVAVRQAVVTKLKEVGTLTRGIAGAEVYGPAAKNDPTWPFVRLDTPTVVRAYDGCTDASRYRFNAHAFAKGADERDASALSAAISGDLDEFQGPLDATPDAEIAETLWTGTQVFRDTVEPDGWHGVVSFEITVAG